MLSKNRSVSALLESSLFFSSSSDPSIGFDSFFFNNLPKSGLFVGKLPFVNPLFKSFCAPPRSFEFNIFCILANIGFRASYSLASFSISAYDYLRFSTSFHMLLIVSQPGNLFICIYLRLVDNVRLLMSVSFNSLVPTLFSSISRMFIFTFCLFLFLLRDDLCFFWRTFLPSFYFWSINVVVVILIFVEPPSEQLNYDYE